jgi:hypothetical protein
MAAIQFTVDGTEDNAITADVARTYLSFELAPGQPMVWWNFGTTYDATIRTPLEAGAPRAFSGTLAQSAVSFKLDTLNAIVQVGVAA